MQNRRIEEKLGFDLIREKVKSHCRGVLGGKRANDLDLETDPNALSKKLLELSEMMVLVEKMEAPTQPQYEDPDQLLKKLRIQDSYLVEEELFQLKGLFQMFDAWKTCLKEHEEELPNLEPHILAVDYPSYLQYRLEETIDEHGLMRSTASDELFRIRKKISRLKEKIRAAISGALTDAKKKGFAHGESEWSLRNGRFVIPLQVAFKRSISGFIMDYSGSGQTAFVEPRETFTMNNDLIDLMQEEKEEIIRILKDMTAECRKAEDGILGICEMIGHFDFLRAKAFLGQDIEGAIAKTYTEPGIDIQEGRHPLLFIAHREEGKPVVPLDLSLNSEKRILIISGPNAGGKSVALKTVGLLQYMHQCGLPVSANEESHFGIFDDFFVDIGDDQSIENDLSTFSSHMVTMTQALRSASKRSLLLFDEFGTGTDPMIGGAIGEALLLAFNQKKCFGVLNTHYPNLKKIADAEEGIVNAAMLFDREKMKPTFEFTPGQAGSSFALEIAKRSGLPENILKRAREIAGEDFMAFDQLLLETQEKSAELSGLIDEAMKDKQEIKRLKKELDSRNKEIKTERKILLNKAKAEAQEILKAANRKIEETIRKIKESQADPGKTKEARKKLENFQRSTKPSSEPQREVKEVKKESFEPGQWVKLKNSENVGRITDLDSREATVEVGNLKMRVRLNQLEPADGPLAVSLTGSSGKRRLKIEEGFDTEIDLRGQRVGEATELLYRFLDQAEVNKVERLRIIHGRGEGHLRRAVADILDQNGAVRKHYHETEQYGGDGVTIVEL